MKCFGSISRSPTRRNRWRTRSIRLLEQWQKHKKTILFITHDVEEALFLSSSVLVVENTPIHTLREITVPMGYPRTRQDLTRPQIVDLREHLVDLLRKQVNA